ncbi:ABC transporter substrate-binding protein [Prosthecobacter sp.]|uniref:ABC transporter substrate-binding protein n=1 Tax=Prosthecobacter sp. TaxID=1965333 RepID=UPI002489631D|nr:ABC transporter substrate-binding protein [Prosthecobacter sp.]MDI1312374.1 ABC transporter substrate-binding protein [Prosthecobacter sp.]
MNKFIQIRMIPAAFLGVLLCAVGLFWPESEYKRPLTVAVNIWPGSERLVMACDSTNNNGLRINLVEMSWSTAVLTAFRKHVADAAVVTLDELIRLEADGAKPRAVVILGVSKGSDAIMGHAGYRGLWDTHRKPWGVDATLEHAVPLTMQSLRGKHIGVELRSSSEYLLRHALTANGMSFEDVEVVPLNLAETEAAFKEGGIDAVVTADPWCTRLRDKGATVIYDSGKMDLELSRVLVVREDVLRAYPRELRSLVSSCLGSNSRVVENGHGLDATLRREGLTVEQWQKALQKIHLPDAAENRRLFKQKTGGLEECLKKISMEMLQMGLLPREVDVSGLFTSEFLEAKP